MDKTAVNLEHIDAAPSAFAGLRLPTGDSFAIWDVLKALGNLIASNPDASNAGEEEILPSLHRFREGARALNRARENAESYDAFLRTLDASLAISRNRPKDFHCALESINKTIQFNLNGERYTAAEWQTRLARTGAFFLSVQYEDRFGALGKIAVVQGWQSGSALQIESWVMSKRAFNRRIEHQILKRLFDAFQAPEIAFQFVPTGTNEPLQDFFAAFLGRTPEAAFTLSRDRFEKCRPALHHRIDDGVSSLLAAAKNLSLPAELA